MDGGVMKLMALLIMLTVLGCYMTKFLLCDFVRAVPYLLILGCSVMGSMISNRYGLLYDKYFYLFAAIRGLEIARISTRKDEGTP